jgi:lipoprotein signal peptidase
MDTLKEWLIAGTLSSPRSVGRSMRRIRRALSAPRAPIVLAFLVVSIDQLTKTAARLLLPECRTHGCPQVRVLGSVELARVGNAGSALGFAQGLRVWTVLALAGLVGAGVLTRRSRDRAVVLGATLLAAGASANLADRLIAGAVTDFIWGGPIVFNLADVALVLGAIAMTVGLYRSQPDGKD